MESLQNTSEAQQIVSELYDEFSKEEMKLKVKYDNNCSRLEEMDQQIRLLSRSEDTEMRVFSPRRHISSESDKIVVMKKEREELEKQNRETERSYRYYSRRAEKLRRLNELMERNEGVFIEQSTSVSADAQIKEVEVQERHTLPKEQLEKIQKRLDNCYHFIDSDSQRCKMEIKNLMILLSEWLEADI